MILDRIVLRNYGVYSGTHEAVLTPYVGKPIILFGGLIGPIWLSCTLVKQRPARLQGLSRTVD